MTGFVFLVVLCFLWFSGSLLGFLDLHMWFDNCYVSAFGAARDVRAQMLEEGGLVWEGLDVRAHWADKLVDLIRFVCKCCIVFYTPTHCHGRSRCWPAAYAVRKLVQQTRHWLHTESWISKWRTPWPSSIDIL